MKMLKKKFNLITNLIIFNFLCFTFVIGNVDESLKRQFETMEENFMMHPSTTHPSILTSNRKTSNRKGMVSPRENNAEYWYTAAQMTLKEHLQKTENKNLAKNVIFFMGDGMSIPTITASRIYQGQQMGDSGEASRLAFEEFPYVGLSKTYCVDAQVADSACSATAYLCGIKANFQTIGVTGNVKFNDCPAANKENVQVSSIADWAQAAGKGTGIVTTTRITHASPAGTYAHVANREYECDADILQFLQDPNECDDIAKQLILNKPGNKFKVILGGGRGKLLSKTEKDIDGISGQRSDNLNLIEYWKNEKGPNGQYVNNKEELQNINYQTTDYLLGLFNADHLEFNLEADRTKEPSLAEMTEAAIKILQKEHCGYFLFVEGGRIDHAHHQTKGRKALDETVQFSDAIRLALRLTNRDDTLIVVTSDHAHTISMAGYSPRGTDILGLSEIKSQVDNLPYTILSYANGINGNDHKHTDETRYNYENDNFKDLNYTYPALFPQISETHGGDDVGVFAMGPWAHLFTGVYEQNVIPHLISFAACIGDGRTACRPYSKFR